MTVHTFRNGLRFNCRPGTTDWNTVNACAVEDEYGLAGVDLDGKLVFDLGAHIGGVAVYAAARGATAVAVEALHANADLIHRNAVLNGVADRVYIEVAAVGDGRPKVIYAGDGVGCAHEWIGNQTGSPGALGLEVRGVSLVELCLTHGDPDVVKLDCEGGEWEVLRDRAIQRVPLVVGEWHPMEGLRRWNVKEPLRRTHDVEFTGPEDGPGGFTARLR